MSEQVVFHFEGSLADYHELNFYEAARFQYAAARLTVKLLQFRSEGRFVKKITYSSNQEVLLQTQKDGSFDISILVPALHIAQEAFLKVSITQMMSYVFERVVGKTSNSDVAKALNTQDGIVELLGKISDNSISSMNRALDIITKDQAIKEGLHAEYREMLKGRVSEITREQEMLSARSELRSCFETPSV